MTSRSTSAQTCQLIWHSCCSTALVCLFAQTSVLIHVWGPKSILRHFSITLTAYSCRCAPRQTGSHSRAPAASAGLLEFWCLSTPLLLPWPCSSRGRHMRCKGLANAALTGLHAAMVQSAADRAYLALPLKRASSQRHRGMVFFTDADAVYTLRYIAAALVLQASA